MRWVAVLVVAAMLAGCSSLYTPRPGRRVSMTMQNGEVVYMRDGQTIKNGAFGAGLAKAVKGVPQAENAAAEFHERQVTGFICLMVAIVALGAGGGRLAYHAAQESDADLIDVGLLAGGMVFYVVGFQQVLTAMPYMYDAINIYNDSVDGFVPRPPNGGVWVPPPAP